MRAHACAEMPPCLFSAICKAQFLHLEERDEGVKEMLGNLASWGIREWPATGWLRYRNSEIMQYKGNHSCYFQAQLSRGEGAKERT